jgi:hypothetical protein
MKEPAYHSTCPHRTHPDNLKTRYSLKNLLKTQSLETFRVRGYTLLEPFVALESDEEFWNTSDGLAVLGN